MLEDEQRLWARSVNSDAVLRLNSKGVLLERGNGAPPVRGGRGGSVDRGRGRGRGGYYQRGIEYEDGIDAPPGGFSRTRHFERSQSIGEKEQRWNERERRLDRIPGRGGSIDDTSNIPRKDGARLDNWRAGPRDLERGDEDGSWRTAGSRGLDKWGRGSSKHHADRDRDSLHEIEPGFIRNGPTKSSFSHRKSAPVESWDDELVGGDQLPEWSVTDPEKVGTFDSSGAFRENKPKQDMPKSSETTSKEVPRHQSPSSPSGKMWKENIK
ncbi:GRB10-interacting GYF protein 1-like isoform X2 [Tachypleus tridentatus]|uniref:GRB10-interacting GYF protein 1-like isoform X2 n=1 Tax=Tachypleus tridentatus TaxID=6853 RepID=UPI003FD11059